MSASTIYLTNLFILLIILSVLISCDSITENDSIIPEKQVTFAQSDYYILPGSTIIINLKSVIEESFSDVTLSVFENPQKGTLSHVDSFLLKYRPGKDFKAGQDHFVLSAMSDGKILVKSTLRINMKKSKEEFPCTLIAVEDKIDIGPGSSVSIPILENDRLCGIEKSSLNISIHTQPKFGQAIVESGSIIYTPGREFNNHDQFIYKLTSSADEDAVFGIISPNEWRLHSTGTPGTVGAMVFVDENTGYLAGSSIYKTSDGGEHWTQVFPENFNRFFTDINFLNAKEGFAVYSRYEGFDWGNDLAVTKDGGSTWTLTPLPLVEWLTSVFFTSSTTGFIAGNFGQTPLQENLMSQILKTEDGGGTWKQVLAIQAPWHGVAIKFADSNTGYVHQGDKIFITQDAGESWKIFASHEYIPSMALITKDILFASLPMSDSDLPSTSIVRFQGASIFKEVANLPYGIGQLEFSPSGNVGFAVGTMGIDNGMEIQPGPLLISKSIDKGETWTEESIAEDIIDLRYEYPADMAVPSENVVYILYGNNIIKYSNK